MSEQTLSMSSDEQHHEVLMQLEAIIFASDAPVSLARLKEAFQARYSKAELKVFLQHLMKYLKMMWIMKNGKHCIMNFMMKISL